MTIKNYKQKVELAVHRHCDETGLQVKEGFAYSTSDYTVTLVERYADMLKRSDVQFKFFYYYSYGEIEVTLIY